MEQILKDIRATLHTQADETIRLQSQRFFKEDLKCYGMKTAVVTKISKDTFKLLKGWSKQDIFTLCEAFWQSGYSEEGFIACNWSYALRQDYALDDLVVFEKWLATYVTNWAACDTLCNHTVGTFIEQFPEKISALKTWATAGNRWVKRGAAVSLIIPARKGLFLEDVFTIANTLLLDPDDLVQKGYGWMLKAASEAHQTEVFDYVMRHKTVMPRTALRYAIEKMPKEMRAQAMAK